MRPGSGLKVVEKEEEEEEEEVVMVVVVRDSIDGPHEAWGCDIFWLLVKFADEKMWLLTDWQTDGPTKTRSYRDARTHLKKHNFPKF